MIERLLNHLSDNEISTETIENLRSLVLDLAIRGKLLPQHSADEPASILLEQALEEQTALIEAKSIKRKKMGPVEIQEHFFEIPSSWEWTRIWRVAHDLGQGAPTSSFSYVDVSSINKKRGVISGEIEVLQPEDAPSRARKKVARGCVIYSTVRPYLNNIAIVNRDFEPQAIVSTAFSVLMPYSQINNRFLYYYLRSPSFVQYVEEHQKGLAYPAITDGLFQVTPIPIPPFSEQLRIVRKVDQLIQLLNDWDESLNTKNLILSDLRTSTLSELSEAEDSEEFSEAFNRIAENASQLFSEPEDVEKLYATILEIAVRGKLVSQDEREEDASVLLTRIAQEKKRLFLEKKISKQKSLPPIEEHEMPFLIPDSWEWARLQDIGYWGSGSTPKRGKSRYYGGSINWFKSGELTDGPMTNKSVETVTEEALAECSLRHNQPGDVLIAMFGGTFGKLGILHLPGTTNQAVCACTCYLGFYNRYLFTVLAAWRKRFIGQGKGGAQPNISKAKIISTVVPIPPLDEQHRIVKKVDELMQLLDDLEGSLHSKDVTLANLMDSLIIEV